MSDGQARTGRSGRLPPDIIAARGFSRAICMVHAVVSMILVVTAERDGVGGTRAARAVIGVGAFMASLAASRRLYLAAETPVRAAAEPARAVG